jgi:Putative peptidoglycan binding domain
MSENPTLRRGDQGVDGWVEYLQVLLRVRGFTGQPELGVFDDITEQWVISYQEYHQLKAVDGIVGDETWSSLRQEPEVQPVGTDGRDPHTYTEHGVELRFTTEMEYMPYDDVVWCRATSVGDTDPATGSVNAYVMIKHPDGTSAEVSAEHENEGGDYRSHAFRIWLATGGGPAGRYSVIMQLPMETGGDTLQFEFDRPTQ